MSLTSTTKGVFWFSLFAHFVITVVMLSLMFVNAPKTWHRSFIVLDENPTTAELMSNSVGTYPMSIFFESAYMSDYETCGDIVAEVVKKSNVWHKGDDTNKHHPISSRMRDICRFKKVSPEWANAADPRSLHLLSSGTPQYLFVTVQIIVFASLLSTSSVLKNIFSWPGESPGTDRFGGWSAKRVYRPIDQLVAAVLLILWVTLSFILQSRFVIVYNNLFLVVVQVTLQISGYFIWSWKKTNDVRAYDGIVVSPEPQMELIPLAPSTVTSSRVDRAENNSFHRKMNNQTVVLRVPNMKVPMVPYDEQPTSENEMADGNVVYHMIDETFDLLYNKNIIVFPRLILASSVLPVLVAAAMYKSGSIWLYSDIFYMSLFVFLTTVITVPLYAIVRITVADASKANGDNSQAPITWFVTSMQMLFLHVASLGYLAYYCLRMFVMSDIDITQAENSVVYPMFAVGACALYNLVIWLGCWLLIMSPAMRQSKNAFAVFSNMVELLTAICITLPALVLFVI